MRADCDDRLGLQAGDSLSVARYLLANRSWLVDMNQLIKPTEVLMLLTNPLVVPDEHMGEVG